MRVPIAFLARRNVDSGLVLRCLRVPALHSEINLARLHAEPQLLAGGLELLGVGRPTQFCRLHHFYIFLRNVWLDLQAAFRITIALGHVG